MKRVLLTTALSLIISMSIYAQKIDEWKKPPKASEKEIGIVNVHIQTGQAAYKGITEIESKRGDKLSDEELYKRLLEKAKDKYGNAYPDLELRSFKSNHYSKLEYVNDYDKNWKVIGKIQACYDFSDGSAMVVLPDPQIKIDKKLTQAITKALQNIIEGSRLSLDQIRTINEDKEDFKDKVVEILLDEGFKVVAKDYLEKLYEEQRAQQSGIYNNRTTVQENNFSAVGYYINVKQSEESIKVQVINVSTGEYESNVTVALN
ncbi:MAG: hypothetical protein J6T81_02460 [Bacteroidales bacterium]|nr:hypothetical protein [Bacteroidales bacterium]